MKQCFDLHLLQLPAINLWNVNLYYEKTYTERLGHLGSAAPLIRPTCSIEGVGSVAIIQEFLTKRLKG